MADPRTDRGSLQNRCRRGPEDVAAARIHASDESVDPPEIEKMVVAQALLIQLLAKRE
jgi:hypothetical protein